MVITGRPIAQLCHLGSIIMFDIISGMKKMSHDKLLFSENDPGAAR